MLTQCYGLWSTLLSHWLQGWMKIPQKLPAVIGLCAVSFNGPSQFWIYQPVWLKYWNVKPFLPLLLPPSLPFKRWLFCIRYTFYIYYLFNFHWSQMLPMKKALTYIFRENVHIFENAALPLTSLNPEMEPKCLDLFQNTAKWQVIRAENFLYYEHERVCISGVPLPKRTVKFMSSHIPMNRSCPNYRKKDPLDLTSNLKVYFRFHNKLTVSYLTDG